MYAGFFQFGKDIFKEIKFLDFYLIILANIFRLVTLFSIERFVAVMFPLHRFSICNRKRNQTSILVLVLFALIFYSFGFGTSGLELDEYQPEYVSSSGFYVLMY